MSDQAPNPTDQFLRERESRIAANVNDRQLRDGAHQFMRELVRTNYIFNFSWMGRPVIQLPQDLMAMQEIIFATRPEFIIETGIAHGGSLVFYASMLELLGRGRAIGIDIDIRSHNRAAIEAHPLFRRIVMVEGSSTSQRVMDEVKAVVGASRNVLVALDSNHSHAHVLRELELYTPFVSQGGYCVVFDTAVEDFSSEFPIVDRPWGPGNNPKTAVQEFLRKNDRFVIDKAMDTKVLLSACPDGFLRCVK